MTRRADRIRGLYLITAETSGGTPELIARATAGVAGGARVLQYRDKSADAARRLREAAALAALCRANGVTFIVNDDVELAAASGADGVHLGREDAGLAAARRVLGAEAIIGVSCYDSLERACEAAAAGASYVAFGSFFPSPTKPNAVRPPLSLLGAAKARLSVPLVAIGGIDPDNAASLVEAGADALAVISSVFLAADPKREAERIAGLFG